MKITRLFPLLFVCWTILLLPVDATLNGSVQRNDNQENTPANTLQAEVDAVVPPVPNRFALQTGQQHLISDLAMQQFSQPKLEPQETVTIHLPSHPRHLQSNLKDKLSAIGIEWNIYNGTILYVDPNSDLYGQIQCGDVFMSMNGLKPQQGFILKTNFGNEQTLIDLRFLHNYQYATIMCHRHPITWFAPWFQEYLMSGRLRCY